MNTLRLVVQNNADIRSLGSAALDLAYVAAGRYDGFWISGLNSWDMAAGALLIQEAGGLVSDDKGGHNFMDSGNIVAANTKIYKPLITALNSTNKN
jgi:myo-inositol-1(or 4)-monophosphatase